MRRQNPNSIRDENGELTIDIWAVARSVLSRWWLILMVGVALAAITFVIFQAVHVDTYTAEGNIYLVSKGTDNQGQQGMQVSDAVAADRFMNDYLEIMQDQSNFRAALARVEEEMLDTYQNKESLSEEQLAQLKKQIADQVGTLTVEGLQKAAKVWNNNGTHFIWVSVTSVNDKLSYAATRAVLNSSVDRLRGFYGVEQVDVTKVPDWPLKKDASGLIKYTLIAGLAGMLIVIAILAFLYIKDDKVNTSDDVEQYLGLTVLAMIPVYDPDDAASDGTQHR